MREILRVTSSGSGTTFYEDYVKLTTKTEQLIAYYTEHAYDGTADESNIGSKYGAINTYLLKLKENLKTIEDAMYTRAENGDFIFEKNNLSAIGFNKDDSYLYADAK
jgi:hypothetical protein